jgi:hypothetical protein
MTKRLLHYSKNCDLYLKLVSNRLVTAIAEDVLDASGTTKLLDEELLGTAAE